MYCIDSSALVFANQKFPLVECKSYWQNLEDVISQGQLNTSEIVCDELKFYEEGIYKWAIKQRHFVIPLNEELLDQTKIIVNRYPQLIDPLSSIEQAAPYLLATAKLNKMTIVTEKIKLLLVCQKMKIESITFNEMTKILKVV
ncbi:MAG: DUF4411 family protein [Gammaproteobacteria bacterium]|jgi:hypothetical protein|nr:DUF4411 family protein [Gammaproteobacteria bacterium]